MAFQRGEVGLGVLYLVEMGVKPAVVLAPILPQAPVVTTAHNLELTKRTEIALMEAAQVTDTTLMSRIIK